MAMAALDLRSPQKKYHSQRDFNTDTEEQEEDANEVTSPHFPVDVPTTAVPNPSLASPPPRAYSTPPSLRPSHPSPLPFRLETPPSDKSFTSNGRCNGGLSSQGSVPAAIGQNRVASCDSISDINTSMEAVRSFASGSSHARVSGACLCFAGESPPSSHAAKQFCFFHGKCEHQFKLSPRESQSLENEVAGRMSEEGRLSQKWELPLAMQSKDSESEPNASPSQTMNCVNTRASVDSGCLANRELAAAEAPEAERGKDAEWNSLLWNGDGGRNLLSQLAMEVYRTLYPRFVQSLQKQRLNLDRILKLHESGHLTEQFGKLLDMYVQNLVLLSTLGNEANSGVPAATDVEGGVGESGARHHRLLLNASDERSRNYTSGSARSCSDTSRPDTPRVTRSTFQLQPSAVSPQKSVHPRKTSRDEDCFPRIAVKQEPISDLDTRLQVGSTHYHGGEDLSSSSSGDLKTTVAAASVRQSHSPRCAFSSISHAFGNIKRCPGTEDTNTLRTNQDTAETCTGRRQDATDRVRIDKRDEERKDTIRGDEKDTRDKNRKDEDRRYTAEKDTIAANRTDTTYRNAKAAIDKDKKQMADNHTTDGDTKDVDRKDTTAGKRKDTIDKNTTGRDTTGQVDNDTTDGNRKETTDERVRRSLRTDDRSRLGAEKEPLAAKPFERQLTLRGAEERQLALDGADEKRLTLAGADEKHLILAEDGEKHLTLTGADEKQLTLAGEKHLTLTGADEKQLTLTAADEKHLTLAEDGEKHLTLAGVDEKHLTLTGADELTSAGADEKQLTLAGADKKQLTLTGAGERQLTSGGDDEERQLRSAGTERLDHEEMESSLAAPEDCDNMNMAEDGVTLTLLGTSMWRAFSEVGTEMIINKCGRRMFPIVALRLSGLEPRGLYELELEVVPADCRRYKFVNSTWVPVGAADSGILNHPYPHNDSPNTGDFWMSCRQIQFNKVKLTNSRDSADGNMLLHSLHKYVVQVNLRHTQDVFSRQPLRTFRFRLSLTSFMAVTAYQNERVTKLKIHNNPFAKAFRDCSVVAVNSKKRSPTKRHYSGGDDTGSGRVTQKKQKVDTGRLTNPVADPSCPPFYHLPALSAASRTGTGCGRLALNQTPLMFVPPPWMGLGPGLAGPYFYNYARFGKGWDPKEQAEDARLFGLKSGQSSMSPHAGGGFLSSHR